MKTGLLCLLLTLGVSACLPSTNANVKIGDIAPDFTAIDTNGVEISLNDFKGKNIVLEWSNHQCPFVKKHYDSGNMQQLQKEATSAGDIWLTIVSSAKGKQGSVSADKANQIIKEVGAHSTTRILDPSGKIGRLYGAKTTPHMFIINKEGRLVYIGAIDSDPSFRKSSIEKATNYIHAALKNLHAREPVEIAQTKPYGCSIKY